MKIEKISENQIRCTLSRADLDTRQLNLSELAYGSEKAKTLFQDMMRQAASEFGFVAENMPLMIEAIPSSSGSVVLIITKVDDPEELDTRFSKFTAPKRHRSSGATNKLEGSEHLFDLLESMKNVINDAEVLTNNDSSIKECDSDETSSDEKIETDDPYCVRLFRFENLDCVILSAKFLGNVYTGTNTLYKDPVSGTYILAMTQSTHTTLEFNRICNMLSEYGDLRQSDGATLAFLEEHCVEIVSTQAIQQLKTL